MGHIVFLVSKCSLRTFIIPQGGPGAQLQGVCVCEEVLNSTSRHSVGHFTSMDGVLELLLARQQLLEMLVSAAAAAA
jgi:hypothetical protein